MNYIKIEPSEQLMGKKQLLSYQLSLLNIIKRYKEYGKLRDLELKHKRDLKKLLASIDEQFKELNSIMPKISHRDAEIETTKAIISSKNRQDLELEIDEIKHKLDMLS